MSAIPGHLLKLQRAERHILELKEAIEVFHASQPYEIKLEESSGMKLYRLSVRQSPPEVLAMMVGDAIHNMRAALDLLAVAIVRHSDPGRTSYNHVHFVVGNDKSAYEARISDNMKGASAAARAVIDSLLPYKGGNDRIWQLHQLDILDKHKALIPVGAAYRTFELVFDPKIMFPNSSLKDEERAPPMNLKMKPADKQFPLQDGATLLKIPVDSGFPDPKFEFEVAFGREQIIDGEELVPALMEMYNEVRKALQICEDAQIF